MRGNSWLAWLLLISIVFLEITSKSNEKELFLRKFKIINKRTKSPINILTKKAKKVKYPPLHLQGIKSDPVRLINTGKTVEVFELNPKTRSHATGGVLGDVIYPFGITKFLWTNNKNGTAASKINGKGFPIEAVGYFYNGKYKTFKESLKHRDGIATIIFPVTICSTPSETFPAFAKELRKVLKAGSSTITQLGITFAWYDQIPENVTYFAYPGSYHDPETGKMYYCETVVVPDYPGACITEEQYASTFGLLENAQEKSFTSTEKTHPFRQPVVEAHKVTQTILNF